MEENRNDELELLDAEEIVEDKKTAKKKEKNKKEKKPRVKWKELPADVRKKKRKRYIWIGVGVVILFFFVGSKIAAANSKMPVMTVAASVGDVESTISTSGKVESDITKNYYSQISGNIGTIPVKEGQAVKAGDVLLYFDEQSLEIASVDAQAAALTSEGNYKATMLQDNKNHMRLAEANINLDVLEQQITGY